MLHSDDTQHADDIDPEEEMRRENSFMKIKLQAEFGAVFEDGDAELPPNIELEFLNNIYEFEKARDQQKMQTVADLLEKPLFTAFEKIQPEDQENAWQAVLDLYEKFNISVDFIYEYPLELKYRFLTEELPMHQTFFANMPGMMQGFIFEEFHPNAGADLEAMAQRFLNAWLDMDADSCQYCLSDRLVQETGELLKREDVADKLKSIFKCFEYAEDRAFEILETSYDKQQSVDDREEYALGYAEGIIRWTGILDNGEKLLIKGPFKLYFESKFGGWSIMYFTMPGWKWAEEEQL